MAMLEIYNNSLDLYLLLEFIYQAANSSLL